MDNSRIIAIRDLLISFFSPDMVSYDYPYWYIEGDYPNDKDILMDIMDTVPEVIFDGFSFKKIDDLKYHYTLKFSFPEDKAVFNEIFNSQDDFDEE
ncbi:MAG: hypothetical protein ACP5QP_00460 [Brevinematia bacterium]